MLTGVRLHIEARGGSKYARVNGWTDGSGDFYRQLKQTFHFVGGGSWYQVLRFNGWAGDAYDVIDTDYDPDTDYGTAADPPFTLSDYTDEITETTITDYIATADADWLEWEPAAADLITTDPEEAFQHYDTWDFTGFATAYDIVRSDGEGSVAGFWEATVNLQAQRLTVLTPVPAKVRVSNGDDTPTIQTLTPGAPYTVETKTAPGEIYTLTFDQLQWSPWSGA